MIDRRRAHVNHVLRARRARLIGRARNREG